MVLIPFSVSAKVYYSKSAGLWDTPGNWINDDFPPYNGDLKNGDVLYIDHNITLKESFLSGNSNKFVIHIGGALPCTLIVEKDFLISNTIDIVIYEGSSFIIGIPQAGAYDFCNSDPLLTDGNVKFLVDGSNHTPSLKVQRNAIFLLYGDFKVNNNFDVDVSPGGLFKVMGGFTAGNSSSITLTGAGAEVGCDMLFDNGAEILMDVGTLSIGGDMLFGNTATISLTGSTITVGGSICSYPGKGSGSTVYLLGTPDKPSAIYYEELCEDVNIAPVPGVVLPIELLSFTSQVHRDEIVLSWRTASETNNDFFTIERSQDMRQWEVVGFMTGAGNSARELSYTLADRMPEHGLSYYRLKQTDYDGHFEYFTPLAVMYLPRMVGPDFVVTKSPGQWIIGLPGEDPWRIEVFSLKGSLLFSATAVNQYLMPAPRQAVVIRVFNGKNQFRSRVVL